MKQKIFNNPSIKWKNVTADEYWLLPTMKDLYTPQHYITVTVYVSKTTISFLSGSNPIKIYYFYVYSSFV